LVEKEALVVVNEIWAKVTAAERFIVFGAVAVLVGWIVGVFLATVDLCGGIKIPGISYSCSFSYWAAGDAGTFGFLGLLAAVAAVVVIVLKVAPNMKINWPMPVNQILLGICVATLAFGLLVVLMQLRYGLGDAPIMMWIADVIFVGGGAAMAWFSYQQYMASKTA
jgi:hypothetical protein